ncbi:hypothetical protein JTE90_018193 [Oedothorax gibbosus]|uniref:Transposase n=1 Tax=Oedothorax gibbosus TaxID=931172 RepID=A0AAV6U925_9ARAC|nr:hypothetical protein JTE90_018193 [Oedothorax gibbosus]
MPPKSYKVIDTWFKKKDKNGHPYSEWCKKLNDEEIQCIVCNKKIACISKGWQAVTQHENSSVHKEAAVKLSKTQLLVSPRNIGVSCGIQSAVSLQEPKKSTVLDTGKSLQLCHSREEACKAELIWAMKMVQSNISTTFVEDITEVFKTMFTTIPQGFSLGRTKLTYLITEALGPFFRNVLIEDAKKSFYK